MYYPCKAVLPRCNENKAMTFPLGRECSSFSSLYCNFHKLVSGEQLSSGMLMGPPLSDVFPNKVNHTVFGQSAKSRE